MPKHDPPNDDGALLDLERELLALDRAIRAADENQQAIPYAMFDRRDELMARIFDTPAAGLAGLAVQARLFLAEHEVEFITAGKQRGRSFMRGQSGNPAGRPRGAGNKTTLAVEALLDGEAKTITRKAIELAKAGDISALRLCLDRIAPRPA